MAALGARRAVCRDAPRRGFLLHWLDAHGRRGHGVHSPYLYAMCRVVFRRSGRGPQWVSRAMPRRLRRIAGEAERLSAWNKAARLAVPKGWRVSDKSAQGLVESSLLELIGRGELARGERVVAVMQKGEWARLAERAWKELTQYLGDGSWLILLDVRADEASWQRWRWLSECTVFTVCIDRWSYGMVVRREGMARYSFGVR